MIAIYARQSIERKDSVSIEAQIDFCKKFASGDYKIFRDVGYSGKNTNRPEFERLLQEIKKGNITTLISYRLDRISRSITDFAELLKLFEHHGVNYISATEQFDTSSPMGRAMIYIVMVFAQLERETIAERVKDNYKFRALQGLYLGGGTPFGYSKTTKTIDGKKVSYLTKNEDTEILKSIFSMYLRGYSIYSIVAYLNKNEYKTATGKSWSNVGVKRVLQNISPCCADYKLYSYLVDNNYNLASPYDHFDGKHGMCMFFKTKNKNKATPKELHLAVVGTHQPIISSDTFIAVQKKLSTEKKNKKKQSKKSFLSGLVVCKDCGYKFGIKSTTKGTKSYSYLYCRGKADKQLCDNKTYLPLNEVESGVMDDCKEYLHHINIKVITKISDQEHSHELIKSLNKQMTNLISNVGKGNCNVDELLIKKIEELKKDIKKLENTPINLSQKEDSITAEYISKKLTTLDDMSTTEKTLLLSSLLESIKVGYNGELELRYHF